MNYKKLIEDSNNGTIDKEKVLLVIDNDGGYWDCGEDEELEKELEEKYGCPSGYSDVVDILVAAGVEAEWC